MKDEFLTHAAQALDAFRISSSSSCSKARFSGENAFEPLETGTEREREREGERKRNKRETQRGNAGEEVPMEQRQQLKKIPTTSSATELSLLRDSDLGLTV